MLLQIELFSLNYQYFEQNPSKVYGEMIIGHFSFITF